MVLQDRAKATRGAIIAGAAEVFAEHGYGNASLTQVAEAAQVTKGALYFHFRSKEVLAMAVVEEQHRMAFEGSKPIFNGNRPALTIMILMCRMFGLQLVNEPVVKAGIRLTFEATSFGPPLRGPYQDWIDTMTQLAEQGVKEKQIRESVDPAVLARYIVASFTGVQMVSDVLTDRADVMERIEDMWALLLPGIMHDDFHEDPKALSGLISGGAANGNSGESPAPAAAGA